MPVRTGALPAARRQAATQVEDVALVAAARSAARRRRVALVGGGCKAGEGAQAANVKGGGHRQRVEQGRGLAGLALAGTCSKMTM